MSDLLSGGSADKISNDYEYLWVVYYFLKILRDEFDSIIHEPIGISGIDFVIRKTNHKYFCQVKRRTSSDSWTYKSLEKESILKNFFKALEDDSQSECYFISWSKVTFLNDLSEKARRSDNYENFKSQLNNEQQERLNQISIDQNKDEKNVFQNLKKISIKNLNHADLEEYLLEIISLIFRSKTDSRTILASLKEFSKNNLHKEINSLHIQNYLSSLGITRNEWSGDDIAKILTDINKNYENSYNIESLQIAIPRPEIDNIFNQLTSNDFNFQGVVLTGEAGIGKSHVSLELKKKIEDLGWPVLAFRLDRINTNENFHPHSITRQITGNLIDNISPDLLLEKFTGSQKCLFLIDQLDAISQISGRNSEFFSIISSILDRCGRDRNLKVLLVCREFDFENDARFRKLAEKENARFVKVKVLPIPEDVVRNGVSGLGYNANELTPSQLKLFSLPIHLKILSNIKSSIPKINFETSIDLYDKYLKIKYKILEQKNYPQEKVDEVLNLIVEQMNERQVLFVSKHFLNKHIIIIEYLVSENLLNEQNNQYSFFHESFFDFYFATRFIIKGEGLSSLLLSGEQHLFRRAQVRQILFYLRIHDKKTYLRELEEILENKKIRYHIQNVVFSLLKNLDYPLKEEWFILCKLLNLNLFLNEIYQILVASPWIKLLTEIDIFKEWLAGNDEEKINKVFQCFSSDKLLSTSVIWDHINPYIARINAEESWQKRFKYLLTYSDKADEKFLEIFEFLVKAKLYFEEDQHFFNFWTILQKYKENDPKKLCDIIYLHFQIKMDQVSDEKSLFEYSLMNIDRDESKIIAQVAKECPEYFLEKFLPFLIKIIKDKLREDSDEEILSDGIWYHQIRNEYPTEKDVFLSAILLALRELARNDYSEYLKIKSKYFIFEFLTLHYLIIHSLGENENLAEAAIDYILGSPCRFISFDHKESYWSIRNLMGTFLQYWSNEKVLELENKILNYYTKWERSANGRKYFGKSQFYLLSSIKNRLSRNGYKRYQELERKFSISILNEPGPSSRGGFVGSPLSKKTENLMSDEEWISAMKKYNGGYIEKRDFLAGNASELAMSLKRRTIEEPYRFANLLLHLPENIHLSYYSNIFWGLSEVEPKIDSELAFKICRVCIIRQIPIDYDYISRLVQKYSKEIIPVDILENIGYYAVNAVSPEKDYWKDIKDPPLMNPTDGKRIGLSIDSSGLNSTRGRVARDIGDLIFEDKNRINVFLPYLEKMVEDSRISVRSQVVYTLLPLLNFDRDLAVKLFLKLCDCDEALLSCGSIESFIYYALFSHFYQLKDILQRMINSDFEEIQEIVSRRVAVLRLQNEEHEVIKMFDQCWNGSRFHRLGIAKIFSHRLREEGEQSFCASKLLELCSDLDQDIQRECKSCFSNFVNDEIGRFENFILAYIETPCFKKENHYLLTALCETNAHLPKITYQVVNKIFDLEQLVGTRDFYSDSIPILVFRLYHQSKGDPKIESQALDLIDKLIKVNAYKASEILSQYER